MRSSIGARPWRSMSTNSGSSTAAGDQAADHERVVPAGDAALGDAEHEPGQPDHEGGGAEQVEPADRCRAWPARAGPARPRAPPASASGTLNQNTQCQEIATSAPPSTGPSTSPTAATIVFVPIARPSCSLRERVGDERGGVGEQERAADALQDPPQDQLGAVGRRSRRRARRARRRRSRRRRRACGRRGRTAGPP